jgi:hypothetical protein
MSVPELRQEVLSLCDILQGILAFNYRCGSDTLKTLDNIRAEVPSAHARVLRQYRDKLRSNVKEVSRLFGLRRDAKEFTREFKKNSRSDLGIMLLPKVAIDATFTNYTDRVWPEWSSLPPHLLVYLDFTARVHQEDLGWVLPEASLYEDMCVAYNMALEAEKLLSVLAVTVRSQKLESFLGRL